MTLTAEQKPNHARGGATEASRDSTPSIHPEDSHQDEEKTSSYSDRKRRAASPDDDKLEARRAANRRASFDCRMRQKKHIKDLQRKNATLELENDVIRLKLQASLAENRKLQLQNKMLDRNRTFNLMMQQVQQQVKEQKHILPQYPERRSLDSLSEPPKRSDKGLEILSSFALANANNEQQRQRDITTTLPLKHHEQSTIPTPSVLDRHPSSLNSSNNILRNQIELHRLQEDVRVLRGIMARARGALL